MDDNDHSQNGQANHNDRVAWKAALDQVVATLNDRINFRDEYQRFGIEFTADMPNRKGFLECRAFNREDRHPSAAVKIQGRPPRGIYKDFGSGEKAKGFFKMATMLRPGEFPRPIDAIRYYAEKHDVKMPDRKKRSGKPGRPGRKKKCTLAESLASDWFKIHDNAGALDRILKLWGSLKFKLPIEQLQQFTEVATAAGARHAKHYRDSVLVFPSELLGKFQTVELLNVDRSS